MPHDTLTDHGMPFLKDPENLLNSSDRLISPAEPTHICYATSARMLATPDSAAQAVSETVFGEPLTLISTQDDHAEVTSLIDGYKGWIDQDILWPYDAPATHLVSAPMTHMYSDPELKSSPLGTLTMGSHLTLTGNKQGKWLETSEKIWVFAAHVRAIGNFADDPVDVAMGFLDTPYLWGGRSATGIDCSGLVQVAMLQCGLRVHRDSDHQFVSLGADANDACYGDLAFFPGHIGFMLDSETILHANATHMAVTIDPLDDVIAIVEADLKSKGSDKPAFLGFKRL